jgi:hypothetical protein
MMHIPEAPQLPPNERKMIDEAIKDKDKYHIITDFSDNKPFFAKSLKMKKKIKYDGGEE